MDDRLLASLGVAMSQSIVVQDRDPSDTTQHRHTVRVFVDGEQVEERFCGHTWCDGTECGLPALICYTDEGAALRARTSMVASGPVFQRNRTPWLGQTVDLSSLGTFDLCYVRNLYWR